MLGSLISFSKYPFFPFLLYTVMSLVSTIAKHLTVFQLSAVLLFFPFPSAAVRRGTPCCSLEPTSPPNPSVACITHQIPLIFCNLPSAKHIPIDQACNNCLPLCTVNCSRPESVAHILQQNQKTMAYALDIVSFYISAVLSKRSLHISSLSRFFYSH